MRNTPSFAGLSAVVLLLGPIFLTAPAGCSGGGVTGDCQRICGTVTGCYGASSLADACTSSCLERAGGADAGPVAAAVVRGCADCVSGQSCLGLAAGACNASCPSGTVSTSPGGSSSPPSGDGCEQGVPLEAGTGRVACERGSRDYHCKCYEDGVFAESFTSIDFCSASTSARAAQASKGCRW